MIRTQFNNQPKFAVLELRMGRHMNLFDRTVTLSVTDAAYVNSAIIADDEVPPGYRVFLWGAFAHANTAVVNGALSILSNNGTTYVAMATNAVLGGFFNLFAESSYSVVAGLGTNVTPSATLNTGVFADDGYGIKVSIARNGANALTTSTVTVRAFGCVAPAQLTTAQWVAGAGGSGSGTGGGNDQQIR